MTIRRIASIDLGTNTARLLIADCFADGSFNQICLMRSIIRLGGGFCKEKGLAEDAIERARCCLAEFAAAIHTHGVTVTHAVATSAVRDAANGSWFISFIAEQTGIKLNIIDGLTEGTITLSGVLSGLDEQSEQILMFDVGGGSTEYTVARGGHPIFVHSLPLGVVRLTEGKPDINAMQDKIRRELQSLALLMEQEQIVISSDTLLVGTAGTATTLAAISLEMVEYDYRKVNNHMLSREEIQAIYMRLSGMSPLERLQVTGMEKGREDLIIAGTLITLLTMEQFNSSSMKVSDYGLLEGLVVSH